MTSAVNLEHPAAVTPAGDSAKERRRLPLVEQFLREQATLTAVERFAQLHDAGEPFARKDYYRDLLPASPPAPGQQYAFQVDLDACTGCKACVTACHNLNGLDPGEAWRSVGLLHGGTVTEAVQQSVTTACHHCLDPACMNGCPVGAYEKDPETGIVKHLDDQCIGCQYCTFTCPYDVPKYSASRGIVRKCDMCSERLAVGEAPACVQACPNEAIAITIVDRRQVLEDAQGDAFVPGAPSPGITGPTTVYKTTRALPRNLLPADFYAVRPSHSHTPLVAMLVLTQLSAGAFCVDALAPLVLPPSVSEALDPVHSLVAAAMGLAALGASVFHLGRPIYAFRALIGLRTSWMSREILAFGAFAGLAILYAASFWTGALAHLLGAAPPSPAAALSLREGLRFAVATAGVAGVLCSVLIYHVTRRVWWAAPSTGFKFAMTAAVLGLATAELTLTLARTPPPVSVATGVARVLLLAAATKACGELLALRHLRDKRYSDLRRTAVLLTRDLRGYLVARYGLLAAGAAATAWQLGAPLSLPAATAGLILLLGGELLERTLFFAAMCSPGMPGGPA
ncbi:MAG TPA: DmsC/YnfH family molybdoenzyme membrane anchor subunit [Polyangiaceae bacterium]|nr:DmsC/YnfH family molybdoenzyme membrane anchor subunit [Polyangiaceae bacterium]